VKLGNLKQTCYFHSFVHSLINSYVVSKMNCWVPRVFGKSGRDSSVSPLILLLRSYATRSSKPTPPEIPFQPKLANAVSLIGQLLTPLQFHQSPDGNAWAAAVITRQESPSSPSLSYAALSISFLFFSALTLTTLSHHARIPLIFEGDLAHTAKCHLKLNDFIHIAGNLTTHPHPPQHPQQLQHQTNIQVPLSFLYYRIFCYTPLLIFTICNRFWCKPSTLFKDIPNSTLHPRLQPPKHFLSLVSPPFSFIPLAVFSSRQYFIIDTAKMRFFLTWI